MYNYIEGKIALTQEIGQAVNGYISVHTQRPFLMQMIASYGLYLKPAHVKSLEKYFGYENSTNKLRLYNYRYRNIIDALVLRTGIDLYIVKSLSKDQLLGVLYTGTIPITNNHSNLAYNYYRTSNIANYLVGPQFSRNIYYQYLHKLDLLNSQTLLDLLQSNEQAYSVIKKTNKCIYVYSADLMRILLIHVHTLLNPLDNQLLMQTVSGLLLRTIFKESFTSNITYLDMTLTNQQLADKYNIRNIYTRIKLFELISAIKFREFYSFGTRYYRRADNVLGDGKLFSTMAQVDIDVTDIDKKYIFTSITSIIDAVDARNNPDKFLQVTGYEIKFTAPNKE